MPHRGTHREPFHARFLLAWQAYERAVGGKVDGQAFAQALGVSRPLVSAWQEADAPPPHERVLAIAEVSGVDPGWLAYGPLCQAPMEKEWPQETRGSRTHSGEARSTATSKQSGRKTG